MILVRIFRFLRGYVEFEVRGGFTERFLNLCARMNLDLWGVKRKGDKLIARIDARAYHRLNLPAHRSGMRLHARRKRGIPFLFRYYRARLGVLVGLGAAILLVAGMTPFIWSVRVDGASPRQEQAILEVFEELGVHSGARSSGINVDSVVLKAYGELPEISWMALNLHGCSAVIEVREKVEAPKLADDSTPCNIVAKQDGQIYRIQPYAGSTQADVGSAVVRGDLLISGAVERRDGGVTFVHAQGEVYARTRRTLEVFVPFQAQGNVQEEVGRRYRLGAFFLNLPLGKEREEGDGLFAEVERRQMEINGVPLPFYWEKTTWYREREADFVYTEEEAFMTAAARFAEQYDRLVQEVKITGGAPEVEMTQDGCRIRAVLECEEDIALEAPMDIE